MQPFSLEQRDSPPHPNPLPPSGERGKDDDALAVKRKGLPLCPQAGSGAVMPAKASLRHRASATPPPPQVGEYEKVVVAARAWIGTPYRHQASLRGEGCDCIGLVRGVWREVVGKEPCEMPPYSPDWAEVAGRDLLMEGMAAHFLPVAEAEAGPGDVVVFRMRSGTLAKHAAILSVDGLNGSGARIIHAYWGHAVVESWMAPLWRRHVAGVFRFPLE